MTERTRQCSLLRDNGGSVTTMALFMALFLGGLIYYLVGVGDAILYRRIMQDAADAGSYAAAVVGAKGMNLHVLLNVVMAVTAGILLVIRSVEVMLEVILAVLAGLTASVVFSVKAAALIATLTPVEATVERIGDAVERFVEVAHDALDVAHEAVQRGFPVLAQVRGVDVMVFQDVHDPPVAAGFVAPVLGPRLPDGTVGLPVEKADLGVTCDRVADGLAHRLRNVESRVPRWLLRFVGGVARGALTLGKRRTCRDSVVEAPRAVLASRSDGSLVWLGHEEFQYRGYALGEDVHTSDWARGEKGVRLAQGGRGAGRTPFYEAHQLGRVAFAQSELYFDGTEGKDDWMWKQRWRARLRRFRLPSIVRPFLPRSACSAAKGPAAGYGLSTLCTIADDLAPNSISAH